METIFHLAEHIPGAVNLTVVSKSLHDCAGLCVREQNCNAFRWQPTSTISNCQLAQVKFELCVLQQFFSLKVTELEDGGSGEVVMVSLEELPTLRRVCSGGEHCCHLRQGGDLCSEGEGDCNEDRECQGLLVCGTNNCVSDYSRNGGLWDVEDDCCQPRCSNQRPCGQGEGPCVPGHHSMCKAAGNPPGEGMVCSDHCLHRTWFPVQRFPNNSESQGYDWTESGHSCCRRRCYDHSPCGHGEWGCERNVDCKTGHECVKTAGKELGQCVDINECTDPRFSASSLAHCGAHTSCSNNRGSFSCPCKPGYTSFQAGVGCVDLNECSHYSTAATNYCGWGSHCVNTPGWSSSSRFNCAACAPGSSWAQNTGCGCGSRSYGHGSWVYSPGNAGYSDPVYYNTNYNYNIQYSSGLDRQYFLVVPAGYHIRLRIYHFATESCCDKL